MENKPLYDITLSFESELFVSVLDEDFERVMLSTTGQKSGIGTQYVVSHDVKITDAPIVPADEEIEKIRQTIFEEVTKAFSEKGNVEVKKTKFVGVTKITRKD